jgi:23S rRNA A2030 N6-methylase RlmJ
MKGAAHVKVIKQNGFEVMSDTLPPPERRGLAIIDPPYEIKSDYADTPRYVHQVWKKWPQGTFFIWYPILTEQPHLALLTALRRTEIKDILVSEIRLNQMPKEGFAMYGAGVALINPPVSEPAVRGVTTHIATLLPHAPTADVFWLANRAIDPGTGMISTS